LPALLFAPAQEIATSESPYMRVERSNPHAGTKSLPLFTIRQPLTANRSRHFRLISINAVTRTAAQHPRHPAQAHGC